MRSVRVEATGHSAEPAGHAVTARAEKPVAEGASSDGAGGASREFVQAGRAARVEAVAGRDPVAEAVSPPCAAAPPRDWKAYLGKALCWSAPLILVTVLLVGGAGALTGAAGAALPFLAALACPLGMYFRMRSMSKMGDHGNPKDKGGDR